MPTRWTRPRLAVSLFALLAAFAMAACGDGGSASTETPPPGSGKTPIATASAALPLTITEPQDGVVVDTATITVRGRTAPDADLTINGDLVDVAADGSFSYQARLEEGINLLEIVATDEDGNEASQTITIGYVT